MVTCPDPTTHNNFLPGQCPACKPLEAEERFALELFRWLWKRVMHLSTNPDTMKQFNQEAIQRMQNPEMLARVTRTAARAFYTCDLNKMTKEEAKQAVLNTLPNRKDESEW